MVSFIYAHCVPRTMSRTVIRKHNPATLEVIGEVEATIPEEVPSIVERARTAQMGWSALPVKERERILRQVQAALCADMDALIDVVCRETGKPRLEALATDGLGALGAADFAIGRMARLFQESRVDLGGLSAAMRYMGRTSLLVPRPLGVIGIIAPWNYPLAIPYSQTMMALAAGNAVVLKPSSQTPFTALRMGEVMAKAGLPHGLLQVVLGPGGAVGEALVTSGVDRIIFTGHPDVARRVMVLASQRLTPMTLELGGKDAFIVLEDADLRRAARAACWGAFVNCGQTCVAVKRIYVHRAIEERFTELLLREVSAIRQGYDPRDPTVTLGPLISEEAVQDMEAQVARAVEQGAVVLVGGARPPEFKGHFFQPTVLSGAEQGADIVQRETFGPVVVLLPFEGDEEAVRLANDSKYALNGSVWTADLARGKALATRMRSGTVTVNNVAYTYGLGATPWGGRGESGFGRTHGDAGLEELIERQHVHLDRGRFPSEVWWPPYGEDGVEAVHTLIAMAFAGERAHLMRGLLQARRLMRR